MNHREQAIICAVIFTIWLVRLYYKLYDKDTKRFVMSIGFLIVFWMFIRIIKSVIEIPFLVRFFWYLYYLPLIFIPLIMYICSKTLINEITNKRKTFLITLAIILLILVLTNDYHEFVFKFNDGFNDYDNYNHSVGYYLICIWIFFMLGSSMITLAKSRLKIKKDYKVFMPILLLLAGLIYTILYVLKVPLIVSSNMAGILSIIICLGIELILYLDLIPNNKKYKEAFINSTLEITIVSFDGSTIYSVKSFKVPDYIIKDIKNNKVKTFYRENNIIYETKKNKDGFVVLKKDITILSNLQKELDNKQKELLEQKNKLKREKRYKQKLNETNLRNDIISRIEKDIFRRKEKALKMLEKNNVTNKDFKYIKLTLTYVKRKSLLIISEINNDFFDENSIKLIFKELLLDFKTLNINGEIKVNKMIVDSYKMNLIYEIIFSILENTQDSNVMIFIDVDKIKLIIDKNIKIKKLNIENISIKYSNYENETELVIKGVK